MDTFKLPENFMLGTATASAQIEGGDTNNTWYQWSELGKISDGSSSFTACDHWNRVAEDIAILKKLNVQTHRFSIEWSRIEPVPGKFSVEALTHYREEVQLLLQSGIQPIITLHHFSEPIWFQEMGGWTKDGNAELFVEYVQYIIENLGDLVSEWVTFNEPNVYTYFGYIMGSFPPGKRNLSLAFNVMAEMIKTHVKLYHLIHKIREDKGFGGETKVGVASHLRLFDGITFLGKRTAKIIDYIFNEIFITGMTVGKLKMPLVLKGYRCKKGIYADFLGINYYTKNIVEFALDPAHYFHFFRNDQALNKSDLNWDIYPKGISYFCKKYYDRYHLPIYITENGISDKHDNRKSKFIMDHLAELAKVIEEGVRIERYYYWTLMDNFEWLEGERTHFGLYQLNFRTQERTARKSAEFFTELCKNKGVTQEMLNRYF